MTRINLLIRGKFNRKFIGIKENDISEALLVYLEDREIEWRCISYKDTLFLCIVDPRNLVEAKIDPDWREFLFQKSIGVSINDVGTVDLIGSKVTCFSKTREGLTYTNSLESDPIFFNADLEELDSENPFSLTVYKPNGGPYQWVFGFDTIDTVLNRNKIFEEVLELVREGIKDLIEFELYPDEEIKSKLIQCYGKI